MSETTKEDYEKYREVLRKAREQAGTGSDLDILYRFGYWDAVQDNSRALRSKAHWFDAAERYKKVLLKINADAEDTECGCDSCQAVKVAREALRMEKIVTAGSAPRASS